MSFKTLPQKHLRAGRMASAFLMLALATPAICQEPTVGKDGGELADLMDRVWDFRVVSSPLLATDIGDPRGQDRLADMSVEAIQGRHEAYAGFLEELEKIDATNLTAEQQVDHALLGIELTEELTSFDFQTHLTPINNREGFHITLPELGSLMQPKTPESLRNYIARLRAIPVYTDQHIVLMRKGVAAGLTQPAVIMRQSAAQASAQVVGKPSDSLFYRNLPDATKANLVTNEGSWKGLNQDLGLAIMESVVPAYARFAEYLETDYVPACRGSIAIAATPRGREFYQTRIRKFTTLDLSAQQLFETGKRENARIRKEMNAIVKQVDFDGDLPAFLTHLRTDPKFYPRSAEELMKEAAWILKKADGRLPEIFGTLPRTPYGLKPIPDFVAPQTSSAYYWPPSTDGKRGGFFYLNTYDLKSRPLYQLESLSMHEAVPGHHLQLAIQAELQGLHPLRRHSGFTAFIEGWALYSERLGKEIGFYEDPYQEFGRLSMEAWRASRLVVDPGIHVMGWTRKQAIDYMRENTALSEHNIVAEVDRYIGWPGQALAYKTGELEISRLRRFAEDRLADGFDLRAFHDCVLASGSIPLPVLEKNVTRWVEAVEHSFPNEQPKLGRFIDQPLANPFGVEVRNDDVWITTVDDSRVWRTTLTGNAKTRKLECVAGNGTIGYSGDGGPATAASFNWPHEVRADKIGNLYIADTRNHVIRKITAETGIVTTIAGTGAAGYSGDGGLATEATFDQPHSIALDGDGGLFVADTKNHRIRRIDFESGVVKTVAGNGQPRLPESGVVASETSLYGPRAMAVEQDAIWIAFREGNTVWKIDRKTQEISHVAGTGKKGDGGDGGPLAAVMFNGPKGLVVDDRGGILVVDTENHRIRRLELKADVCETIAGGFDTDPTARLKRPHGIAAVPGGLYLLGDSENNRVLLKSIDQ